MDLAATITQKLVSGSKIDAATGIYFDIYRACKRLAKEGISTALRLNLNLKGEDWRVSPEWDILPVTGTHKVIGSGTTEKPDYLMLCGRGVCAVRTRKGVTQRITRKARKEAEAVIVRMSDERATAAIRIFDADISQAGE